MQLPDGEVPSPPPGEPVAVSLRALWRRHWPTILGVAITIAMVAGLARGLAGSGLAGLREAVPASPLFYLSFALLYVALPLGDFVIFRQLWHIPVAGFVALLKKRIANDVVVGYAGEAYFYSWAVARARLVSAPFGAVKDVSILSALAGNGMTLTMTVLALFLGQTLLRPADFSALAWSTLLVVGISLPFLIFSRRVFSLPRAALSRIFLVHCLRLIADTVLLALAWHVALPQVAIGTWLLLVAGRLLVSRLPFVPNKDLLFANFAITLVGHSDGLSALVAVTAALTLLVHAALIVVFGLFSLFRNRV
ncbi:hypothetical protein [Sphingomonas sp. 28-63-12]|uniref:hypothetical protein n=1 Tax=Sphingomonas sp. 28-63-12 TaxID=1970434 RepID=UPI000BD8785D|nr:MAG: hypothetical protein B7Y47_09590 [Sphingomonas sp. 28-63-12]